MQCKPSHLECNADIFFKGFVLNFSVDFLYFTKTGKKECQMNIECNTVTTDYGNSMKA